MLKPNFVIRAGLEPDTVLDGVDDLTSFKLGIRNRSSLRPPNQIYRGNAGQSVFFLCFNQFKVEVSLTLTTRYNILKN